MVFREKVFLTEPSIASSVMVFGPMEQMDTIFFDHLRERELLAWHEAAEKPARLDWLMTAIPREVQGQPDLQGFLNVHDPGSYELRVMGSQARIVGMNTVSGATFYSPGEQEPPLLGEEAIPVASLPFRLQPGESLVLWCRECEGEHRATAVALLRRDPHAGLQVESSDGIRIGKLR